MKKTIFFLKSTYQYINRYRFKPIPCHETYFQMLDYSNISDESDIKLKRLTIERDVTSIPPLVFYHQKDNHNVLRFYFAKKDDTLDKAAEKLCKI